MTLSPIPKALSTFLKHNVNALLIGGQACILYGAAEFSRDIDIAVMVSAPNLDRLRMALDELGAKRTFVPDLSEDMLMRGHACHFRCQRADVNGLRVDILGFMRGLDPFPELWERREEIELPEIGKIAVMSLPDLVKAKKTQRDKDWPMIRRLIEADFLRCRADPTRKQIRFWLRECRTPALLIDLAKQYANDCRTLLAQRPLLKAAREADISALEAALAQEENMERQADRNYWAPLRAELTRWRREKRAR